MFARLKADTGLVIAIVSMLIVVALGGLFLGALVVAPRIHASQVVADNPHEQYARAMYDSCVTFLKQPPAWCMEQVGGHWKEWYSAESRGWAWQASYDK